MTLVYAAAVTAGLAYLGFAVWFVIEVITAPADFEAVKNALEAAGLKPEVAEVTMRPENTIELAGEDAAKMQKLLDVLEDLDDVQDVFHNAEINQ